MIKDRGNIKWSTLMLPEHREKLKALLREEKKKDKPEIDEQKYDEMNNVLQQAIAKKIPLEVLYYQEKEYRKCRGIIQKYQPSTRELIIIDEKKKKKYRINMKNILDLSFF